MNSAVLMLIAIAVLALSGAPAVLFGGAGGRRRRQPALGQQLSAGLLLLGSGLGLVATGLAATGPGRISYLLGWALPIGQPLVVIDGLAIVFLLPVFVVPALGAVYGLGYWRPQDHPHNSGRLCCSYGLLAAAMALVVVAGDSVLLLIGWEVMALAAFFVATVEDHDPAVCRAGWVYLIATHLGTLCLIAMFALLRQASGSFELVALPEGVLTPAAAAVIFVLALVGFGVKAGLMPLHVWLPGAHANAPSHVSAVLSGVMLKIGIYGIVRMTGLLPIPAPWWGGLLIGLGVVSGICGIAFALGQSDLKRLLAYSSIENIGIITIGLGLAVLGRALDRPEWILFGLGGAVLHVWNHSLFKSLLFLNAGAVIHATHTRSLEQMGGLAKRMPVTAGLFALGAAAICALPPLNGFAGEFLIYQGLFHTLLAGATPGWPAAALAAVALALIGALAGACFVRVLGVAFLGEPRATAPAPAADPPLNMLTPMLILAAACVIMGVAPGLALPLLRQAALAWNASAVAAVPSGGVGAGLALVGMLGGLLIILILAMLLVLYIILRRNVIGRAGTWDCGYARPTARIQYTAASVGQLLVELLSWMLWPRRRHTPVRGVFPGPARFATAVPDTVLDRLVLPVFRLAERFLPWLRLLQKGKTHVYLLYILAIVLALLLWRA